MFGKKVNDEDSIDKLDTILGKDTSIEGVINAGGSVRIDGRFKGEIITKGDLVIGDDAKIESSVTVRNIYIGGSLIGNVKAEGKLEISATGKLYGDVTVQNFVLEEGAVFKGNCQMKTEREENRDVLKTINFKSEVSPKRV
jgi:cytoskeletal protein CcmA (bactofilin family)